MIPFAIIKVTCPCCFEEIRFQVLPMDKAPHLKPNPYLKPKRHIGIDHTPTRPPDPPQPKPPKPDPITEKQFQAIKAWQRGEEKSLFVANEMDLDIMIVNKAYLCATYQDLLKHL